MIYQLSRILTALLHVAWQTLSIPRHVHLSGHVWMTSPTMLNQQKIENYVIIASFKSETMGKLILEYQVCVFWYQVYQARLWDRMFNCSSSLPMSTSIFKILPGKLDIKRRSPSILDVSASLAMSTSVLKTLPGNLIWKDIYQFFPFPTIGSFHLAWYNKLGKLHYTFYGVAGWNFTTILFWASEDCFYHSNECRPWWLIYTVCWYSH